MRSAMHRPLAAAGPASMISSPRGMVHCAPHPCTLQQSWRWCDMKTALHSISYSGSWGQAELTLDAIIARAASLGFDGLMLAAKRPHASLLDMSGDARRRLRDILQQNKVGLACLAAYTNFTADAEHAEVPHREMQIHYVGELCRLAVELGGKYVRIFTSYEHSALPYSRAWDLTVRAIKE